VGPQRRKLWGGVNGGVFSARPAAPKKKETEDSPLWGEGPLWGKGRKGKDRVKSTPSSATGKGGRFFPSGRKKKGGRRTSGINLTAQRFTGLGGGEKKKSKEIILSSQGKKRRGENLPSQP